MSLKGRSMSCPVKRLFLFLVLFLDNYLEYKNKLMVTCSILNDKIKLMHVNLLRIWVYQDVSFKNLIHLHRLPNPRTIK